MIAVAILMVFSVAIASVWVLSGDVLEGEYASAPSGVATLPADVPLAPGADVHLEAVIVDGAGDAGQLHGVYDDIAIYQTRSNDVVQEGLVRETRSEATPEPYGLDRSLVAVDVQSGQRLWERENTSYDSLQLSGDVLIGSRLRVSKFGEVYDRTLYGINLHNGEELWATDVPDDADRAYNSSGWFVLFVDSLVVIPGSDGMIRAWDIQTGELRWESKFDPGTAQELEWMSSEDTSVIVKRTTYAATVWNDRIVIVNDDNSLQVLSSQDGETVSSYSLSDLPNFEFRIVDGTSLQLLPMPSNVVLFGSIPGSGRHPRSIAIALDPMAAEFDWIQQIDGVIGSPSISDDGTLAINSQIWHQNGWFLQLLGQSGYPTFQFFWYDGETGERILHTERTRDKLFNFAVTNGNYACIRTEMTEIVCLDEAGTRHIIDVELFGDMVFVNNVLYIPTEDGLYRVELP